MSTSIEIKGLDELLRRMAAYPQQLKAAVDVTMNAVMLELHASVPPYPAPPDGSTYRRTETLGRSLGSGYDGGNSGTPSIYEVREMGSAWEAHFGTNLEYAPYVIGDTTQAGHMRHWWKIGTVAGKAASKIQGHFQLLANKLAAFLEGQGR